MLVPDLSPMLPFLIGFFVLAAVSGLLAVAAAVNLVVSNRRTRLARRQSVRGYYRGLSPATDPPSHRPGDPRGAGSGSIEPCATSTSARCVRPTSTSRSRQQRRLRRLPPGGAGRHAAHPRPRRPDGRARGGGGGRPPRGDLPGAAVLPVPSGQDRVLGHRGARRVLHDGLRDLPGRSRGRGWAPGLPAGDHAADAVRLRHRAAPPPQRRRARDPAGLPRALGAGAAGAARGRPAARSATTRCTSGSQTSTSTATSTT